MRKPFESRTAGMPPDWLPLKPPTWHSKETKNKSQCCLASTVALQIHPIHATHGVDTLQRDTNTATLLGQDGKMFHCGPAFGLPQSPSHEQAPPAREHVFRCRNHRSLSCAVARSLAPSLTFVCGYAQSRRPPLSSSSTPGPSTPPSSSAARPVSNEPG